MSDYNDPFGLEDADTPEEITEDAIGWNTTEPVVDDHYPETTFVSFDVPLKPASERTIAYLIERYRNRDGSPLVVWRDESCVVLHIPRTMRLHVESLNSEA